MHLSSSLTNRHHVQELTKNFQTLIPKKYLADLMISCNRDRFFNPVNTLHCFLIQTLFGGCCKLALSLFNAHRLQHREKTVSLNSGAYCRARRKLDENILQKLCFEVGKNAEDHSQTWKWKGRNVKLVDGTTLQMEDTRANQKEYPQCFNQKQGLGQPIMRVLGIFGLSSGSLLDLEIGRYSGKGQAEPSLLRRCLDRFNKKDLLVLDRFFTSYFLHCDMIQCELDFVVRVRDEWAKNRIVSKKKDQSISIKRPLKGRSIYGDNYDNYPEQMEQRLIESTIRRSGFRTKKIYLLTNLNSEYKKEEIEKLYTLRWSVELDFRSLKRTIDAYFLTCKTPTMVRKELYVKVLAYNLIRQIIIMTACRSGEREPRKYSFKTAKFLYCSLIPMLGAEGIEALVTLLKTEILNSKYRWEPRLLKKRERGTYRLLMVPREVAKRQRHIERSAKCAA